MPNTLWTVACGGTLHGRRRYLGGIPPSRCHRRTGLSLQKEEKKDPTGARIKNTDNLEIKTFTVIFIASIRIDTDNNIGIKKNKTAAWISFFENKEATTTITTIIIKRRKRKWTTVTASSSLSSSPLVIIVHRTGKQSIIIIIGSTEIASRAGTLAVTSYSSPGKEKEETAEEEEVEEEDNTFLLLVVSSSSSLLSSSLTLLSLSSLSPVIIFATIGLFRGDRVFSEDSPQTSPSPSSVLSSSSFTTSLVGWNPRHFHSTAGDDNNNNNIFGLIIKFKLRLLLLSSPSSSSPPPSSRYGPYYYIVIAVPALKQKIRQRIHTDNNINKNHNVTVILYHNWFLSIGMPRPLDDEFSYEPPGKKNRSSDSTDSTGSSTTSSRKEAPVPKMSKSPRGNQKAASTDVPTMVPKSDIRRAQFKGSKSMPVVDASSPEPILSSTKEAEEIPVAIEMSSPGRPAETTNLHLKYLLQVTDSELQNMSREVPSSQTMSMGVPSGGKPMTNTQLVLAPVTTSQPSENFIFQDIIKIPVSEKGVEKYHVKSDSLEQQGLKLVYTKPTVDNQEARPMSYVAYKPHSQHQHQATEKSLQQQQSMTGDATVGRKRKHPQKQGRHICQYCGRGCAKPSVLEKHIRAHTNERPFPCANCGLSFKTKSNLSKHTKSRTHALKAGLSQSASSTSSETAGTEGDVDAKDTNESEETQTETSDTDGENEDDPQKLRKDMLLVPESHTHLMRSNSEPDTRLRLEEFKDNKCLSPKEGLLLGDCSLSVTTVATAGASGFGGANAGSITRESSDSVQCHTFGETSKSQSIEIGYLQHSSTPYTPVYLSEKKFYVTKLHESKSLSFEGTWDEPSLSTSETTTAKSCLVKENAKSTKMETLDVKLGTTWSKDNVPLSVSGLSLPNKLQSSAMNTSQEQQSVKESEETKPVSSLILSGVPTPSTKEMVEKRISQLISENASIVNTPMKEPPRQKRIFRQFSDPPTSHTPKLDDLPQSSSMSKVSIPSIASIPLTPIPGETDLRKDSSNSPKPFLVSDKYNPQNVVNLTGKSQISSLAASPSKVDQLGEKISSGGHSNSHEIKIEIKLSKVATMSNLVATTTTVAQTMVGQSNIQYMPAAPAITSVSKNPENSVIKGLLMKGKTLPASLNSPSNVKTIKAKSSSVDDISKIKSETSTVSPLLRGEVGTTSSVEFSVGSKYSQLHKMHLCRSGPAATNTDTQTIFEPEVQYEQADKPKLDKFSSIEKDSLSGSFSHSLSSDRESSNDLDTERGERSKDEKMDPTASLFENYDLTLPKKKGRPKGSKNKPKIPPNSASLQLQYQPSASINTSTLSTQQTSILLATLKKKSSLVPQSTLVSTTTTVSSSMIGQPMVSVQNSWTQPSSMIANPVSTPSTPTKLKLKGKILMKRSMSTDRMQSQERESETVSTISSTGSTPSVMESSANLAHLWTSSLDVVKQPTDSDRNERNSPLKKRKVRTSEPSDTVIRPGVTRAGSEPLMSRMGQSWSGSSSMKLFAEKRLNSLPETFEYKLVKALPSTLAPVVSAPVTVPVVIAEPMRVPMKFFDSIQSSAVRRGLLPLPAHHFTLPAIPSSSILRQGKETPQLPAISGLVSFLLHKEYKLGSQESQEEVEPTSKDVEESLSTNTESLSSKIFQSQDDVGISSRSSSVVQGSHSSSQSVNLGALTKTTTEINLIQQHLYGHSVNSLRGLTHTTLCCVQQVQPMYVAQGDNHNISMYSNWKISQPNQDPGSLTAQMLISLYNSKVFSDPIFVVSSAKSCEVSAVDSCKWSLYSKPKAWLSSSYAIEKLTNGIFNIFTTKPESSKLTLEMKLPSEDKDILHASGGSMESTPSSLGVKDVQSTKQPKRVRIFQGGFRSNEDYIYIRGRGRGKYVCEECGIRCKKPSMLKKHIRTHTDLRPYHCRHCRLSFKTKGNLTKHMKSKAHQKKCLELGIVPVPVTVDESQIDSVALAEQSAIAKDTKILDDDNEEDEEDDKDMDDEEETDDADGQFSDSEESARTSFERMDTSETIDTSVDKESECGTPAQTSSLDVAETCCMAEVHSCELSEPEGSTIAEVTKSTTSNPTTSFSQVPVSLQTLTTINAPHRQGATSQLQFVNEIAHSLLDLAQRQIPLAEELPPDHLDATDSVILITTSTATNTTITTASTTTTITSTTTATIQSKAEATEKTLKRQYSFDMDDSPDRGLSKSPNPLVEVPDIQMQLVSGSFQKAQCSMLKQTSSEEIAMINQQTATAIVENSSHKEMRAGEIERIGSQLLTHPSMVALKIDSQEGYQRQPFITTAATAVPSDQPLAHEVYLIPDLPENLQGTVEKEGSHGANSTSTLSLSLTSLLPSICQLVKQESGSGPAISASLISHPQSITPFQFEHPFQAFQRSSNNRNDEEAREESQTVIIPLTTSGTEESTFVCSPKAVSLSQSLSRESSGMEMMVCSSEATTSCQQDQKILPNQQGPNNPSVVSIILSNQTCRNVENVAQQPQLGHKQQSQLVSNSPYTGLTNIPQVVTPTQPFNTNIVVEPQLVENLIPEQSQTRHAELQPVSLMEKSATESKLLVTRQSPTAIVEKTFHSEQCPASFERQSPKLYIDNSQTRSTYGNGQTRVHVERRIPMLEVQPMIPNVQLPPQEVGKLSPTQGLGSLSPTRQYLGRLSPQRQHVERLSPTRHHVERLSPPRQHVERLSPPRQHVERLSPPRQHVERLSPPRQHVERLSPPRHHVERLSPTRQHVDMLSPTRHRVDVLSPTRQSISALSPSRQPVDTLSPSRPHVDTLSSSNQPMDMLSLLRQPMVDKQMGRLSPSKNLTGDGLSPSRQHIDNLSPMRQLSPTSQHMDRLTTFRVCTEKLSPTRPFSSQSPTQVTDKLSPTRLTDKPPFRRQTNRLSPSRHVEGLSPSRHVEGLSPSRHVEGLSSMRQLDRLSPTRQTERISPGRYENLSPTRIQSRLSPCRPEQQWPSDHQLPLRIVETQPPLQLLDGQLLCMTAETQPTQRKVSEKQLSTGFLESQVSSLVSTSQSKTLTMQSTVEGPSPFKDSSSLPPLTLQKSFKEDLNKCHTCNKCFSNTQEYMEHRRQHMKTQTHHSQDSSCGHSRPHLHKCFHSEGHADSRSMSTEEIPRPPDCKNCKMDFWKQNHLPKHLWAKKHRLTLMRNKNSSFTDSESAAPSETMPDTVVTPTSVSGPSRVNTIQGTEKALDLSIDESAIITSLSSTCVTPTCTTVTSVTTTAAVTVTTTAVMPGDMVSHEPALMIAETRCVSREQAAIISADITDHSSFFIHQMPLCKKYIDSSSEEVKDEMVEAEILRSGIRNPACYVLTGDESEISGANVIPITPMAAHATHACHLCSRTFTSAYQLENHLSHTDPRPYVCEYCDAGFSKKQTLHIHLQMHSQQEKPYVCGMCGDTFVTSESLKQHSLIHSNVTVETHRSFDESTLHSYQQGTRISSPLPKAYDRGVHMATSQLCSQDLFSTSFPPMISTPVHVSALNIQQKQPQYRLPSQAQQYMEISPYSTGDTGPVMVTSTLAALALDSVVSKP